MNTHQPPEPSGVEHIRQSLRLQGFSIAPGQPVEDAITRLMALECPNIFATLYPRRYTNLGNYCSPRIIAAFNTQCMQELTMLGPQAASAAAQILMFGLPKMVDKKMPLLFLAEELLNALKLSDYKDSVDWQKLKLPYEHGILVLPKNALYHPVDGYVSHIYWSRVQADPTKKVFTMRQAEAYRPGIDAPPSTVLMVMGLCPQVGTWYDTIYSADVTPLIKIDQRPEGIITRDPTGEIQTERAENTIKFNSLLDDSYQPKPEDIKAFLDESKEKLTWDEAVDGMLAQQIVKVLLATIMALQVKPDLLEMGVLENTVKNKNRNEPPLEFWTPNVIGGKYKMRVQPKPEGGGEVESETGTHASPRMHWRRGHFRNQPCGFLRMDRKVVWIEPMLVSGEYVN